MLTTNTLEEPEIQRWGLAVEAGGRGIRLVRGAVEGHRAVPGSAVACGWCCGRASRRFGFSGIFFASIDAADPVRRDAGGFVLWRSRLALKSE